MLLAQGQRCWQKRFDAASGHPYYYNSTTQESSWEEPAGFTPPPPPATGVNSDAELSSSQNSLRPPQGGLVTSASYRIMPLSAHTRSVLSPITGSPISSTFNRDRRGADKRTGLLKKRCCIL
jgi:hypothetical protein